MCPDTPSLSCWIQLMCHAVCFPVKCVIIPGFVDPHTPQDHRRMIPILLLPCLLRFSTTCFFPDFIPDVLPARYFRKDQKSQFITPLHKMPALRIMGTSSPHLRPVHFSKCLHPVSAWIPALHSRHMDNSDGGSILAALLFCHLNRSRPAKNCSPESKQRNIFIQHISILQKFCFDFIEHRILQIPEFYIRHRKRKLTI